MASLICLNRSDPCNYGGRRSAAWNRRVDPDIAGKEEVRERQTAGEAVALRIRKSEWSRHASPLPRCESRACSGLTCPGLNNASMDPSSWCSAHPALAPVSLRIGLGQRPGALRALRMHVPVSLQAWGIGG